MLPNLRRAWPLLWLSVASLPALAQRVGGGASRQEDPFARRAVAPARAIGDFKSLRYGEGILTILTTTGATLRIRPYAAGVVRVEYYPVGQPVRPAPSISVVQESPYAMLERASLWPGPATNLYRELSSRIEWQPHRDSNLTIVIQKKPLRISYQRGPEPLVAEAGGAVQQMAEAGGAVQQVAAAGSAAAGMGISFQLTPEEHLYGTGSRALPLDRRGRKLTLYNEAHYGYQNGEFTLNVTLPTVLSSRGYLLFFDNYAAGTLDLGATEKNTLAYRGEDLPSLAYFLIAGTSYAEILDRYTTLTGKQPLPPRWALGLIQSRFGYQSEQEMLQTAARMRRAGFPLDALVLDLYWFGGTTRQGDFRWQPQQFPAPQRMLRHLDSAGVKTILITEPYVMRTSRHDSLVRGQRLVGRGLNGRPYTVDSFWAGPATLLDMDRPATRQWLWQQYDRLKQDGVGGWWSDLGEPENQPADMVYDRGSTRRIHNAYGQAWASILSEGYARQYPRERLFNLARSGWAGMQRHSVFPWSGDVSRSWSGLQAQVPIMLGLGLGGVGYMHSDAGGFAGATVDPELYTRWLQMAGLSPIMRPHGVVMPEPFWYPEPHQSIVRQAAHLRYELLPYLYTLAWENAQTGTPLTRPMNYGETRLDPQSLVMVQSEEEKAQTPPALARPVPTWNWNTRASSTWGHERLVDKQARAFAAANTDALASVNDQYLLGPSLLVAPVLQPGQRRRNVVLPAGRWINFYSSQTFSGGQTVGVAAPLTQIPLLVRAGAFLPLAPYVATTARYRTDTLNVRYYADASVPESSFTLYDDDGHSALSLQEGRYELICLAGKFRDGRATIQVTVTGTGYPGGPAGRTINLTIPRVSAAPTAVVIGGRPVPATEWRYDTARQTVQLRFLLAQEPVTVVVQGLRLRTDLAPAAPEALTLEAPGNRVFGTSTELRYALYAPGRYPLLIRNALGLVVRRFPALSQPPGAYTTPWNGTDDQGHPVPNGLYVAEMHGQRQRLVLLRN